MKVIVASYSKCGTKTLSAALTQLGFTVYDFLENFWYFGEEWKFILEKGDADPMMLREMYGSVDAVVDAPTYMFWERMHEAFPDAKIILTIRDEDEWFESFRKQVLNMMRNTLFKIILSISPSGKRLFYYMNAIGKYHFGLVGNNAWTRPPIKSKAIIEKYRRHNQDVLQNCPNKLLLVMDLEDGWRPLCEFLDVDIPQTEFPHKNVGGELVDTWIREHPFAIRMKRETYGIMLLVVLTAAAFIAILATLYSM